MVAASHESALGSVVRETVDPHDIFAVTRTSGGLQSR
jgi:hypothetical protein